ncbi:P-loop containing nucleoside triphosphate hydrolase protein [Ephemerocybe angulata]|uniref:DNA 3'-5' helicase n=1 Tax=Ephemerocybe angulata TaxID=980116 RepID=A0A8H6I5R0_9AGAR|nr:P-loop containing nucleoside triphosphate hydrolase protein [Tulosesus angulatus]
MSPVYNTPEGRQLVKHILSECQPPIIPHDYQTDGIVVSLDGESLLVTMATGSGKSGYYSFLMHVMLAISRKPELALGGITFPENPAIIIVLPTKALQEDMRKSLSRAGLDAVVINGDTVKGGPTRRGKGSLWVECRKEHSMILISPEELLNPACRDLFDSKEFKARVCRLGIDEVHLIYTWGTRTNFRSSFKELGHIRARLPSYKGGFIPLIATSATIRDGRPKDAICQVLGLKPGDYHLLRRSNIRNDIQIITRELNGSLAGVLFPDFDWVLDSPDNTVLFCKTIGLGFRVAAYLWRKGQAKGISGLEKRVRLFNSLNATGYNEETLGFLDQDETASITVATDVLSVGWDSPSTRNAIVVGTPEDLDEFVQKIGRAGRDRTKVQSPRAFLYYTKASLATAKQLASRPDQSAAPHVPTDSDSGPTPMDISIARFLVAECKTENLNAQYNNPTIDPPCSCPTCAARAAPSMHRCQCSGPHCAPEILEALPKTKAGSGKARAKPGQGISKAMRELGSEKLCAVRYKIFEGEDSDANIFLPPTVFLPDDIINTLIDNIYSISTKDEMNSFHIRKFSLTAVKRYSHS